MWVIHSHPRFEWWKEIFPWKINFECFVLKFHGCRSFQNKGEMHHLHKRILLAHLLLSWGGKKATCWMLREQHKAKCTRREENMQKLMLIYAAQNGSRGWMRFDNGHRILIEMLSFWKCLGDMCVLVAVLFDLARKETPFLSGHSASFHLPPD